MRLYNIYYVCKLYYPNIAQTEIVDMNSKEIEIKDWGKCKEALDVFLSIECLKDKANNVYKILSPYERALDRLIVSSVKKTSFVHRLNSLIISVERILKLYETLELGETKSGIDVKIPKCESLKEYMGYLKEVDFVFTQCPFLLHEEEQIKFNNIDVGSQWLAFAIVGVSGSFYILNNLAKLIQKVIEIQSNIRVCKQQEFVLDEYKRKGEIADEVIDVFKKMKAELLSGCVADLEDDIGPLKDGEERGKVEKSLEKLAELIDKGVEIYSSIETPKDIKVLFPMSENNVLLPDNIVKLLEEKSGENKEE